MTLLSLHTIVTRTSARSNFSVIPARVWRVREIPNSAGGRREGPGFFARQPRARMTEQEIEQDRNYHYDLQSSINSCPRAFDVVRVAHFAQGYSKPKRARQERDHFYDQLPTQN